ncbi:MAG: hypothetical protein C4522_01185 [Desulfobacteraceae bacterium]|nr:MAG: hypothetical protein C4522_01185 [Desulfobacteraceae bacterium]
MCSIITLMTDFGISDPYVGVMKGVILGINPKANIVDITHLIEPQNIVQAGWAVADIYSYFPKGTIHVVVVDPGVGTGRRIIALKTADRIFLTPDNGILTLLFDIIDNYHVYEITNAHYFLEKISHTFHGRDIFAPVAAHLSAGIRLEEMGKKVSRQGLVRFALQKPSVDEQFTLRGTIISIDHFGNLITNIDKTLFDITYSEDTRSQLKFRIKEHIIEGVSLNYMGVEVNQPLVLFGSNGLLEISIHSGNASRYFQVRTGEPVLIELPFRE